MLAKAVSPRSGGTFSACSSEPILGSLLSSPSLCQPQPARRSPIGVPFRLTFETTMISGWSGWFVGFLCPKPGMMCRSPKRRVKATCCAGVQFTPRNSRMLCSSQAARMSEMTSSLSDAARSPPSTSAPIALESGRSSIVVCFLHCGVTSVPRFWVSVPENPHR